MTDTSKFTPNVTKLFEPNAPLRILPPVDYAPEKRHTPSISPLSQYLTQFKDYQKQAFPTSTTEEPEELKKIRIKQAKREEDEEKMELAIRQYQPGSDPHIKGDPAKTLFIGRLSYDVSEVELQREFLQFGEIDRARIVRDKNNDKSRGYGFIVFKSEDSVRAAYKDGNGLVLKGRKIITDREHARSKYDWLPRRLGGGLGGRGYTKRQAQKEKEYNDIKRRVESSANRDSAPSRRHVGSDKFNGGGRNGGFRNNGGYDNNKPRYSNNNNYQSPANFSSGNTYNNSNRQRYPPQQQPLPYNNSTSSTPLKAYDVAPYSRSSTSQSQQPQEQSKPERFEYSSRSRREGREPLSYGSAATERGPGDSQADSRRLKEMKEKYKSQRPDPLSY